MRKAAMLLGITALLPSLVSSARMIVEEGTTGECALNFLVKLEDGQKWQKSKCEGAADSIPSGTKMKCSGGFPPSDTDVYCCDGKLSASECPKVKCSITGSRISIDKGKTKAAKRSCTVNEQPLGASLEHGDKATCNSGFPPQPVDAWCCQGELTTKQCGDGKKKTVELEKPKYSDETLRCASGAGAWEKTSEGPRMMSRGGEVTVPKNAMERRQATSDEDCRAQCCDERECWGTVRKQGTKGACWLLFLPTTKVGSGVSEEYFMETKPAEFVTQVYAHALDYVVPLSVADTARLLVDQIVQPDKFVKESFFNREMLLRDNLGFASYVVVNGDGQKEELRMLTHAGTSLQTAHELCEILRDTDSKHVTHCLGTVVYGKRKSGEFTTSFDTDQNYQSDVRDYVTGESYAFVRLEYISGTPLSFASIPVDASDKVLPAIIKQVITTHVELIKHGFRSYSPVSSFMIQVPNVLERETYGMAYHDVVVKLTHLRELFKMYTKDMTRETEDLYMTRLLFTHPDTPDVSSHVVEMVFELLAPKNTPMWPCVIGHHGHTGQTYAEFIKVFDVDKLAGKLQECMAGEAGPIVNAFIQSQGPQFVLDLMTDAVNREDAKASLQKAMKSNYLKGTPVTEPNDLRMLVARSFDSCENGPDAQQVSCVSGSTHAANLLGCDDQGVEEIEGFKLHRALCHLPAPDPRNADEAEPMCRADIAMPEEKDLLWDLSFTRQITKVSGLPTTEKEICCGDRKKHLAAERPNYFEELPFVEDVKARLERGEDIVFRCSVCGTPLLKLKGRGGRTWAEFYAESQTHGWPSFRNGEVLWENIGSYDFPQFDLTQMYDGGRMLELLNKNSFETHCRHCGAHLGHNIPDEHEKMRLCLDVGCIAGKEK